MILTVRLLGLEVLHIELAQPEAEEERDISLGGTVASTPISLTWTRGQGIEHEPESPYEE
jgi:hypothetical protein